MAENPTAAAAISTLAPPPTLPAFTLSSAASLQFISFVNRTSTSREPDNLLELDEADVIWSSYDATSPSTSISPPCGSSASSSPLSSDCRRALAPEKFGLSALLAESDCPTVQRHLPTGTPRCSSEEQAPPFGQSAPVNVPTWTRRGMRQKRRFTFFGEEAEKEQHEEEEEEEWVPPHMMVARSHLTNFSMLEGAGRTLKGRDLRRVRNAVWRQTGFLD